MHVPEKWKITELNHIYELIQLYNFATLVSPDLDASHLPLLLDVENQCLYGHMSRSNGQSKLVDGLNTVAIFSGPHHYISPRWYHHKPAVPTWNYVAIHVHGSIHWLDNETTIKVLNHTILDQELELIDDDVMPREYVNKLLNGVTGFRIEIKKIDAKAKLGQHRKLEDQTSVCQALSQKSSGSSLLNVMKYLSMGYVDDHSNQTDQ